MKYDDFKLFKFSTIFKSINHIRDSFLRIRKKIKHIYAYVVDLFNFFRKNDENIQINNPSDMPGAGDIENILEPYIKAEIIFPSEFIINDRPSNTSSSCAPTKLQYIK